MLFQKASKNYLLTVLYYEIKINISHENFWCDIIVYKKGHPTLKVDNKLHKYQYIIKMK